MRKFIRTILLLANLACIAGALLTYVGSGISPVRFLPTAYLALAYPYLLAANVGFVLLWTALHKWYALLSLALITLSWPKVRTCFPLNLNPSTELAADSVRTLRLLTYNTRMLGGMERHTAEKPNPVLRHVAASEADVVCLQEFGVARGYVTERDVRRALADYPYHHIYYKNDRGTRRMGIATFSKYPIVGRGTVDFPSRYNEAIRTDIAVGGDTVRVINCHLESNRLTEKDKAMPAELRRNFDAEHLTDVTAHLSRKLATAYRARAVQADRVADEVDGSPYPVLVCGDFNDVPLSYAYTRVRGRLQDAFEATGFGMGFTFHDDWMRFRIDYVLCDSAFIPMQLVRDRVPYSDHYPLLCTLAMPGR